MRRTIGLQRHFSEDLRRNAVKEFEKGKISVQQLSRDYNVSPTTIYNWVRKFGNLERQSIHIVEMKESNSQKIKDLESKIKKLERIVGQKQIAIDFKDKMIELAEKEYNISIKKNSCTPQSTGSAQTESK